jgi:hypothetical protein
MPEYPHATDAGELMMRGIAKNDRGSRVAGLIMKRGDHSPPAGESHCCVSCGLISCNVDSRVATAASIEDDPGKFAVLPSGSR